MNPLSLTAIGAAMVASAFLTLLPVQAQQATPAASAGKPAVQTRAAIRTAAPTQGEVKPRVAAVQPTNAPPEKCLRALNGACVNAAVVEETRLRAFIIPEVRVSYFGTPAGTIGGAYIPFERLFQDNPTVFGLPTNVLVQGCCVTRTK